MKNIAFLLSVIIVIFLSACSGSRYTPQQINENLTLAEEALQAGHIDTALDMCNDMVNSSDTTKFSWNDYTRAAAIYAMAYDRDIDTEASMASAGKCLTRARALEPDSVNAYIASHEPEFSGALNTVMQTLDGLNTDKSTIGDHEEDEMHDHDGDHDHETADHNED